MKADLRISIKDNQNGFTRLQVVVLVAALFILAFLAVGLWHHIKITGHLTASDIREIRSVVKQENLLRRRSPPSLRWAPVTIQEWIANISRPIKSIEVTTKKQHESDRRLLPLLAALATTNPAAEVKLHEMEKRVIDAAPVVEVWYADKKRRWDKGGYILEKGHGYILEKGSNGWKIISQLIPP